MDYTQLTLYYESIQMSPFELLKGYKPRTAWDWDCNSPQEAVNTQEQLNQDQAMAFTKCIHDTWDMAKRCITLAQQKKERDVNKYRRPVDFEPEDLVWVKTKNQAIDQPSKKLSEQMAGPQPVLAKEGHLYRV